MTDSYLYAINEYYNFHLRFISLFIEIEFHDNTIKKYSSPPS